MSLHVAAVSSRMSTDARVYSGLRTTTLDAGRRFPLFLHRKHVVRFVSSTSARTVTVQYTKLRLVPQPHLQISEPSMRLVRPDIYVLTRAFPLYLTGCT